MSDTGFRPITFGAVGEDIDKKDLLAVIRRFQNIHRSQLRRIQEALSPRQRDFLDLLPLLFHTNHPLLPGFISTDTPAGIPDYTPGKASLQAAARLSKSFDYRRNALRACPVQAIFLMGSVGSIAYSKKSDLDIWLCHEPTIEPSALEELRQKAKAIETWGASLGLEAHIFFINPDDFRRGIGEPISTESCGSIQHHLLLEEFYRTSLYIAGRTPAWWLVPPEQERQYTAYLDHLRHRRFINFADIIDLGGLERISAAEFLGGTLWHLYKAISSPHKSLLKLLLMESYASEFPHPGWLCTSLKASVHAGNVDLRELDSYILMYRKVEAYLLHRQEPTRLELARECFYLKINELMSQPSQEKHHRRETLKAMLNEWGWHDAKLRELDKRRYWRIPQALEQQKRISQELTQSYQAVSRFAQHHKFAQNLESDELLLLGRRLFAALERKPGKVEVISRDGYEKLENDDLSVHEIRFADGDDGWIVYTGLVNRDDPAPPQPLRKARSLLEIMAWLVLNQFYRKTVIVNLFTASSTLSSTEFRSSITALMNFLHKHHHADEDLTAYQWPARIRASQVFVNVGVNPEAGRKDGMQLTSSRFDAFSFGAHRVNLIQSIDRISFTSWQEVIVSRHKNLEGVFQGLCEMLNQSGEQQTPLPFECVSFSSIRSRSIALRVQEVYQNLHAAFCADEFTRYVIRGGDAFFVFERREGALTYWRVSDEAQLMVELATPRKHFAPVAFDRAALDASPLPPIFRQNREGLIQLFLMPSAEQTEVFILDEKGSLFYRSHPRTDAPYLLSAYALFIAAIQQRYAPCVHGVQYFRLDAKRGAEHEVTSLDYKPIAAPKKLNIRVSAQRGMAGQTAFTIYCNEREFSSMETGADIFTDVARHIAGIRRNGEQYPMYISDIDVPASVLGADTAEQLQTLHLLKYKQKIEDRLNRA